MCFFLFLQARSFSHNVPEAAHLAFLQTVSLKTPSNISEFMQNDQKAPDCVVGFPPLGGETVKPKWSILEMNERLLPLNGFKTRHPCTTPFDANPIHSQAMSSSVVLCAAGGVGGLPAESAEGRFWCFPPESEEEKPPPPHTAVPPLLEEVLLTSVLLLFLLLLLQETPHTLCSINKSLKTNVIT